MGRRLDLHEVVDSTNLIAGRLANEGAPDGTLVAADRQTAGRGRLGRSFFSPGGTSLYFSVILRPTSPPEEVPYHIFAAAVAVAETAEAELPEGVSVDIKWPNDVLLDGRKTSGINLPVHVERGQVVWAVLGIGVNVNTTREQFPPELRELATSLGIAAGTEIDRVRFGEALLLRLEREIDALRAGGFPGVLDRWRKFFRMRGAVVRIGGPGIRREVSGTVEGVDAEGALLVRSELGLERILAGDVTVLARRA